MAFKNLEEKRASKRAAQHKYYLANRERRREENRAYLATDVGYSKQRACYSRQCAIRRGAVIDPDFKDAILADILLSTTTCAMCSHHVDLHDTIIDHFKAIVFGGAHSRANIQIICSSCDKKKTGAEQSLAMKLKNGATKSVFALVA
jgi:5-methylcytosine-specific restriction endonuclease McrA